MILYSFALALGLFLTAPWWLFRMFTTARYREGFRERLGGVPPSLRAAVLGKRTVWVHAVSVGEVLAVSSLIGDLERTLAGDAGPAWQIVVSTTTRTGQQLARQRLGPEYVFYFPLDFRFAVRAWMRALQPEMLILTESELWPRLLRECASSGVPVVVVNARVSDRSFERSGRFGWLWKWMTAPVTLWLTQSDRDSERLLRLGAPAERVHTAGNLKYDSDPPGHTAITNAIQTGAAGRPIVVAGSTVAYGTTPEEGIVLDAMSLYVWPEMPNVLLVLAPRHPERFTEAGVLAAQYGTMACATDLVQSSLGHLVQPRLQERIVVLDTIGDLASLYRSAHIAFVGGSLLPHGGHNPLEPAQFGVPVVMGPHFENFRDIVSSLQAAEGIVVLGSTEPEALGQALVALLTDMARAQAIGQHGRSVCDRQRGATGRTIAALLPLLRNRRPAQVSEAPEPEGREEEAQP